MPLPFTARLSAPADVLVRELDGESVLLHLGSETYFGLDETGTRIWSALTTAPSIQAAYDALLETFDVEPEVLRRDLTTLIDQLMEHELLEQVDPA